MSQQAKKDLNKPVTDELIMKITKEVVVKFIEVGRLSPAKFEETFHEVHQTVSGVARGGKGGGESA